MATFVEDADAAAVLVASEDHEEVTGDAAGQSKGQWMPARRAALTVAAIGLGLAAIGLIVLKGGFLTKGRDKIDELQLTQLDQSLNDMMALQYKNWEWNEQGLGSICTFDKSDIITRSTTLLSSSCKRECMDTARKLVQAQPGKGWRCVGINYQVGYALQCTIHYRPANHIYIIDQFQDPDIAAEKHGSQWHQCYLLQKKGETYDIPTTHVSDPVAVSPTQWDDAWGIDEGIGEGR